MNNYLYPIFEANRFQIEEFIHTFDTHAINHSSRDILNIYNVIRTLLFISVDSIADVAPINTTKPQYEALVQKFKAMSNQNIATILVASPTFSHLIGFDEDVESELLSETGASIYASSFHSDSNKYLNFFTLHKEAFKAHLTGSNPRALDNLFANATGMTLNTLKLIHYFDEDANGTTNKTISAEEIDLIEKDLQSNNYATASLFLLRYTKFSNLYKVSNKALIDMANATGSISFADGQIKVSI